MGGVIDFFGIRRSGILGITAVTVRSGEQRTIQVLPRWPRRFPHVTQRSSSRTPRPRRRDRPAERSRGPGHHQVDHHRTVGERAARARAPARP